MSGCARIREALPCFVGDDLDPDRAAEVREHLRDCLSCRREAVALQQSRNALRRLGAAKAPGVDEPWFAALQADILAEVGREVAAEAASGAWSRRWLACRWPLSVAAAAGLFLCGWWLVREAGPVSLLDRPPLATTVGLGGPAKAVPWSGGRVEMRPLGDEGGVENGLGPGMMGRWRLRTLEGQGEPASWPPPDAEPRATDLRGEAPVLPRRAAGGR